MLRLRNSVGISLLSDALGGTDKQGLRERLPGGGDAVSGPDRDGPERRQGRPLSLGRRKHVYLVMMGACVLLIVLAWMVIWRYSIVAAVVMSAVALVVPPLAAIIANAGPANRQ